MHADRTPPPLVVSFQAIRLRRPLPGPGNRHKCSKNINTIFRLLLPPAGVSCGQLKRRWRPGSGRARGWPPGRRRLFFEKRARSRTAILAPPSFASCRSPASAPVSGALPLKSGQPGSRWVIGDPGRARPAQAGHPPIGLTGAHLVGTAILKGWKSLSPGLRGTSYPGITGQTPPTLKEFHQCRKTREKGSVNENVTFY